MTLETIVTLEDGERYYLADETVQNGIKYFLANKLDGEDNLTEESFIFQETVDGADTYLDLVEDETVSNYIAAVFTANFVSEVDEM